MRKLYLFDMVTLDGYFEGPAKWDLGWHNVDAEFNQFAVEQLDSTGIILFGRVTYEGMASYWTTHNAMEEDPEVARRMNAISKVVFSRTMLKADWNNTLLVREDAQGEITRLKQQDGKDLAIFGSANLASGLIQEGLVDEFRIIINPVVLGKGEPLFKGVNDRLNLQLLKVKKFNSGNVMLCYKSAGRQ